MGGRALPIECEHGRIVDWGDFGGEPEEPEHCEDCGYAELARQQNEPTRYGVARIRIKELEDTLAAVRTIVEAQATCAVHGVAAEEDCDDCYAALQIAIYDTQLVAVLDGAA